MSYEITSYASDRPGAYVRLIEFAITADAEGEYEKTTTEEFMGLVRRIVTIPDETDVPENQFDVYLQDQYGADIIGSDAENCHNNKVDGVRPDPPGLVAGALTLAAEEMGAGKKARVIVYISE